MYNGQPLSSIYFSFKHSIFRLMVTHLQEVKVHPPSKSYSHGFHNVCSSSARSSSFKICLQYGSMCYHGIKPDSMIFLIRDKQIMFFFCFQPSEQQLPSEDLCVLSALLYSYGELVDRIREFGFAHAVCYSFYA